MDLKWVRPDSNKSPKENISKRVHIYNTYAVQNHLKEFSWFRIERSKHHRNHFILKKKIIYVESIYISLKSKAIYILNVIYSNTWMSYMQFDFLYYILACDNISNLRLIYTTT